MNPRSKVIYISGKYSGTPEQINENIRIAREYAVKIWNMGFTALCPHTNTINFENDCTCTWQDYIDGDLEFVRRSDALFMLPDWENSKGAVVERDEALKLNKLVFTSLDKLLEYGEFLKGE